MGQKTNPNILRLNISKKYNYRYIEKKASDQSFYDFNTNEISKFVYKFCKDNKINIHNCRINYTSNKFVHVFISYYSLSSLKLEDSVTHQISKLNKINDNRLSFCKFIDYLQILKSQNIKNYKLATLKKSISSINFNKLEQDTVILKPKLNNFKNYSLNYFALNLSNSIKRFLSNNIKVFLTFQQLNSNLNLKIKKDELTFLKKSVLKLNRYKRHDFFEEGVNTMFLCSKHLNSADLLASFIANKLSSFKRHNFFLRFVKDCLTILKNNSKTVIKGIKIKIKGRINRRPRAKHKFYNIGKKIPVLTIDSNINYSEKTAFTPNGTLGIKVWTL